MEASINRRDEKVKRASTWLIPPCEPMPKVLLFKSFDCKELDISARLLASME